MTNAEVEKERSVRYKGAMFDDEDSFGIIKAILNSNLKSKKKCNA